ncbi:MAG: lipopolysaccharide kinase InaA family protein [Thermodesulfobacteriota bacterium]|nr:lipopolysaccharide kinase InaA family protein [Thermodesulfobacteriota bacterium]
MSISIDRIYDSYHFGSSWELTDQHVEQLIRLFNAPTNTVDSVLGGRNSVTITQLEGVGSVVVKHYTRGGLIRRVVKRRYLKWGKTRGQIEYEVLQKVRGFGLSAPEPLVYAYRGNLLYKAWLVTREIKQQQTLAELSCLDEERARIVMKEVAVQAATLIENNIVHADLHPGNVLVDSSDRVFIVDFDKAFLSRGNRHKLRNKYLTRWQRSVIKHRLPEMLYDILRTGLGKNSGVS